MKKTTSDRLKEIMKLRSIRQIDILNMCKNNPYGIKLNKSDLSQYVSGKFLPKQDKLTLLAYALNVSETWLMGFDVPMEKNKQSTSFINNVDNEKIILIGKIDSKINLLEYNQLEFINTMLDYLPNIDSNNTDSILTYIKFLKSSK